MTDPRQIVIHPIDGALDAVVDLPGSKSITNRALVIAALADGTSTLHNVGLSNDTEAMIAALRTLGVTVVVDGTDAQVTGGTLHVPTEPLDAQMSGTSARFLTPLVAIAGGGSLTGHPQLQARPMVDLTNSLRHLGITVDGDNLPLTIGGSISGSTVSIDASVSSQFISALLLSAPGFPDGLQLTLVGDAVSQPYIDMTIRMMGVFGATVVKNGAHIAVEPGGYESREYVIEPDASTATYPLAAAAIVGGRVIVRGLGSASIQGDADFALRVLEPMGAFVYIDPASIEVRGSGMLDAIDVDLAHMSDTAPTFAALAAKAVGTSSARGIGFIRDGKESNRVDFPVVELKKSGLEARSDPDGFTITGGSHDNVALDTYDDHRMAMALALLGLSKTPITINDPACTAKTYPGYWDLLEDLRSTAHTVPHVLAIDGPAGSGKSTVAKLVSARLRLPHLDTGAMYRSVTLAVLRSGVALDDDHAVALAARSASIVVGPTSVIVDGTDVTDAIREPDVTAAVSSVAANPGVRVVLAEAQRHWARVRGGAVLEGRDIGTAVFPDATLKIYLSATVEERARRRATETGDVDMESMEAAIALRDHLDMTRDADPLTIAEDAVVIDSTAWTIDEVVEHIVQTWSEVR